MEKYFIYCVDKIGLSVDGKFHQVKFEISEQISNERIKILCVNKINEIHNPKYPYFFIKINDIIKYIDSNIVRNGNYYNVELVSKELIYKLKFIGLCDKPIYCLSTNKIYFSNIIRILNYKYSMCYLGIFKYNNLHLISNMLIEDCNFKSDTINDIYCTPGNYSNCNFTM